MKEDLASMKDPTALSLPTTNHYFSRVFFIYCKFHYFCEICNIFLMLHPSLRSEYKHFAGYFVLFLATVTCYCCRACCCTNRRGRTPGRNGHIFFCSRIGGADIGAILGETGVYLSILEIFDFLKIKNTYTAGFNSINGFYYRRRPLRN